MQLPGPTSSPRPSVHPPVPRGLCCLQGWRPALPCAAAASLQLSLSPVHHSVHCGASAAHRDGEPRYLVQPLGPFSSFHAPCSALCTVGLLLLAGRGIRDALCNRGVPQLSPSSVHREASAARRDGDPCHFMQPQSPFSSFQAPCTHLCTRGLLPLTGMRTCTTSCSRRVPSALSRPHAPLLCLDTAAP